MRQDILGHIDFFKATIDKSNGPKNGEYKLTIKKKPSYEEIWTRRNKTWNGPFDFPSGAIDVQATQLRSTRSSANIYMIVAQNISRLVNCKGKSPFREKNIPFDDCWLWKQMPQTDQSICFTVNVRIVFRATIKYKYNERIVEYKQFCVSNSRRNSLWIHSQNVIEMLKA